MLAAIVAWLVLALILWAVAGPHMLWAVYVVCSAGAGLAYTMLVRVPPGTCVSAPRQHKYPHISADTNAATDTDTDPATDTDPDPARGWRRYEGAGGAQKSIHYMAALRAGIAVCVRQHMLHRLLAQMRRTGAVSTDTLTRKFGKHGAAFLSTKQAAAAREVVAFSEAAICAAIPKAATHVHACIAATIAATGAPAVAKWVAAHINTSVPVIRVAGTDKYSRHELFGSLPIPQLNFTVPPRQQAARHPIFGYGLVDTSPPAQIADNHIWDTYLDIQCPRHVVSVRDTPRITIFAHRADFGALPVRSYSIAAMRIHRVTIDVYSRNLRAAAPATDAPGKLDVPRAPASTPMSTRDAGELYRHLPLRIMPQDPAASTGLRAGIVAVHHRQLHTQKLRANAWVDYVAFVRTHYAPKKSPAGGPLSVYDYILDLAAGAQIELGEVAEYIDATMARVYARAVTYAAADIAAQIQVIDLWLKACGDSLDAIVSHDLNYDRGEVAARITGHSSTPDNFAAVQKHMHSAAKKLLRRYQSVPPQVIAASVAQYPALGVLRGRTALANMEAQVRRHTSVTAHITPYTLRSGSIVMQNKEKYTWEMGPVRHAGMYTTYPAIEQLATTYICQTRPRAGDSAAVYAAVAQMLPGGLFAVPTPAEWLAALGLF